MKIGQILDSQITASSSRNDSYAPKRGRLKNVPFIKRGEWMPLADDNQLVIFTVTYLMSIIIQFKCRLFLFSNGHRSRTLCSLCHI